MKPPGKPRGVCRPPCKGCGKCGKRWRALQPQFFVLVLWPRRGQRRYFSTTEDASSGRRWRGVAPRLFTSRAEPDEILRDLFATGLVRKAYVRRAKLLVRRKAEE